MTCAGFEPAASALPQKYFGLHGVSILIFYNVKEFLDSLQVPRVLTCNTLLLLPLAHLHGLSGPLEVYEFVALDKGVESGGRDDVEKRARCAA